jgi:hypothetical protein
MRCGFAAAPSEDDDEDDDEDEHLARSLTTDTGH